MKPLAYGERDKEQHANRAPMEKATRARCSTPLSPRLNRRQSCFRCHSVIVQRLCWATLGHFCEKKTMEAPITEASFSRGCTITAASCLLCSRSFHIQESASKLQRRGKRRTREQQRRMRRMLPFVAGSLN